MSHYFNNGRRTPAMDAAYLNPPGDRPMTKRIVEETRYMGTGRTVTERRTTTTKPGGVFGPDWAKWRGAIMRIELPDEPPFAARLDEVSTRPGETARTATVTVLDARGAPTDVRRLPWPPAGTVRVVRAP